MPQRERVFLGIIMGKKLDWWARVGLDSLREESKTISIVREWKMVFTANRNENTLKTLGSDSAHDN